MVPHREEPGVTVALACLAATRLAAHRCALNRVSERSSNRHGIRDATAGFATRVCLGSKTYAMTPR